MCEADSSVAAAATELLGIHQHQERSVGHVAQAAPATAAKEKHQPEDKPAVPLSGLIAGHDCGTGLTLQHRWWCSWLQQW
jgi:hypothetical protein